MSTAVRTLRAGDTVTYNGSDGQRHSARIVSVPGDGTAVIVRGYYDPLTGTRVRFGPADAVRLYPYGDAVVIPGA